MESPGVKFNPAAGTARNGWPALPSGAATAQVFVHSNFLPTEVQKTASVTGLDPPPMRHMSRVKLSTAWTLVYGTSYCLRLILSD